MLAKLEDHARSVVESKSREEAGRILIRMKDMFSTLFNRDSDSTPRVWTGKEDVRAITKTARSALLKLLSVMAAIRLDKESDKIENTLSLSLVDVGSGAKNRSIQSFDPLASSSWQEVPSEKTLITPVQCKSLWRQFNSETDYIVTQAISAQDDTAFKKQSALFALAVSYIVLINMWCHDIGREQAANKPLLKIVFQVMMRLFSPRKTTLLFVIRYKSKTPGELRTYFEGRYTKDMGFCS